MMASDRCGERGTAAPSARRRLAAWGLLIVVLGGGAWGVERIVSEARPPSRPRGGVKLNVLLITADTTRADRLGCYGRVGAHTPNMDRLAAEGTRFAHCASCAPLTLPSHSSIMTAVYPYVHGARRNGVGRLADANLTLAEALQTAGYRTQATVASLVLNEKFGIGQGFEVYHEVIPSPNEREIAASL